VLHTDRGSQFRATREELRIAIVTWIERTYRRRRQAALRFLPFEIVRDPGLSLYRNGCPVGLRAFCARTLHGRPRWHGSGARGVTVAASVVRQAPQGRPRRRARRSTFRSGRRLGPTRDGVPAAGWGTAPGCWVGASPEVTPHSQGTAHLAWLG